MKPALRRAVLLGRPSHWVCTACRAQTRPQTSSFTATAVRAKTKRKPDLLPKRPARTRFAPSPTGYLHLGSLRTALFNYLLAKRTGGHFVLRIEDTDQKRTVPGAEQRLYEDLEWAGLTWDEGPLVGGHFGPYKQSERTEIYAFHARSLISSGHAYRCFCSPERLDTLARHRNDLGLAPGYDGTCTHISKEESDDRAHRGEAHVVRLRVAEPYPFFYDIVYGKTGQNKAGHLTRNEYELTDTFLDPILIKSDGHPTYHFANVVDDYRMRITHVIRGTEWMSSTPMHVALYKAFGWKPPQFAHVPLLVDLSGQKLSKRNADIDIAHFRDQGVMPGPLVNFAALLGWSHRGLTDRFTLGELEAVFELKLTKGNATVAFEKLWYLQKRHAQRYVAVEGFEFDYMTRQIAQAAEKVCGLEKLAPILKSRTLEEYAASLLREGARSYTTPQAFVSQNATFFTQSLDRPAYNVESKPAADGTPVPNVPIIDLHTAASALSMVPEPFWNVETHRANIEAYIYELPSERSKDKPHRDMNDVFKKKLYHYLRWALSAGTPGIPIPATMVILGRDETVRRLEEARALTGGDSETRKKFVPSQKAQEAGEESKEWMGSLAGARSGN